MPILSGDVKLVASSVMDDVPEGGGAPSATVIADASTNSIFPDVSELDRALGRVNLRKVSARVRTPDTEGYYGVNIIVAEPFADPRVCATLFSTDDVFDRRSDATARMEAYLARGATYAGYLFGNHLAGQSVVVLLQRTEAPLPVAGQTLVLTKFDGLSNETSQFVRITGVTASQRAFQDDNVSQPEFTRLQVVCEISDALQHDFNGFDALRSDAKLNYTGKTRTSETVVADAANYYGCVPLTAPVAIGDFSVQAQSVFTQIVPSTRIEVPIVDARMNQRSALPVGAGGTLTRNITQALTTTQSLFIGGSIEPTSLSLLRDGITLTDKGGLLMNGATQVGTVDYSNGVLALVDNVFGTGGGTHAVSYRGAVLPVLVNFGIGVPVTAESQRLSYVLPLDPPPIKGSTEVSYRALGNWYVLRDDGSGALRGTDSRVGAGTVSYSTGTVSVTLGALPDVGTAVIVNWGNPAGVTPGAPVSTAPPSTATEGRAGRLLKFTVPRAIKPGSVLVTWNDGSARSVADNSSRGLTGYGVGHVDYQRGEVWWQPTTLPPKNTVITLAIDEAAAVASLSAPTLTDGGAVWNFSVGPNVQALSFRAEVNFALTPPANTADTSYDANQTQVHRVYDTGAGVLAFKNRGNGGEVACGTINYASGACTISKSLAGVAAVASAIVRRSYTLGGIVYAWTGQVGEVVSATLLTTPGAVLNYAYVNTGAGTPRSEAITLDAVEYALADTSVGVGDPIVAVREFKIGPNHYSVVADSLVYMNTSPATGVGTAAGSYSPATRRATLTLWGDQAAPGSTTNPDVSGAVLASVPASADTAADVSVAVFRTAVSPLLNGGFSVAGNYATGAAFTATADTNGVISTGSAPAGATPGTLGVFGKVDYDSGVIELRWGQRTNALPAEDPLVADVSYLGLPGVDNLRMASVKADTLRYNAVGYNYLPLDAEILGLDPVRLPADGRVPIFRPGNIAVLGHTGSIGPAAVSNAQVLNCGRSRLSRLRVIGADGQVIDTGYTADLDAGTLTFNNVAGYSQPVTVEHRIEDTMLVRDVQISGLLTFTRPATHGFPAPGSYVSSALVAGDVRARVQPAFDQVTWTGVWSDASIGAAATGTFNDTLHPILTTNLGALTERWAVQFTNTTSFQVFGEHVGVIAIGNTGAACSPMNPQTSAPYFTIPAEGWGLGWSTGNVMRFNTVGAEVPVWIARTILQGPETVEEDSFTVLVRGDVDRP